MVAEPSLRVKLYGTEAPVPEPRVLRAGPLSVELVGGALRYARYQGVEVLRGIDYLLRDASWGTVLPELSGLRVEEAGDGFRVGYDARCVVGDEALTYRAEIAGRPDSLRFRVVATAGTEVRTNRCGFVVLHPLEGVAGQPVEVTRPDGSVERLAFPRLISPAQPIFDIRALAHEVAPGLRAACRMEGGVFEMEDHRNWTDASFKTYIRPISWPRPYTIAAGETFEQSVSLTFEGAPDERGGRVEAAAAAGEGVTVTIGSGTGGRMPRIGLGVPASHAAAAVEEAERVARLGVQVLVCELDAREGAGEHALRSYRALAEATGAEVVLELLLPGEASPAEELAVPAAAAAAVGLRPAAVAVSPAAYLKSWQPQERWPDLPPLEDYYAAARAAFPGAAVGGGMFSYFTELNRKRPPVEHLDFVTHTTSPLVHDADDRAVMESLEALPYVVETVRSFIGGTPYRVGPSMIGMRLNPYGAAPPVDNHDNRRVALARNDPRQRGLFGAAWNAGYVAELARGGVEVVTLSAPVGEHGVIHRRMPYPQPWFDDLGAPAVYPVYHVVAALAAAAGTPMLEAASSAPGRVRCVVWEGAAGPVAMLASVTDRPQRVAVEGLGTAAPTLRRLDAGTFVAAATDAAWWERAAERASGPGELTLDGYAVVIIGGDP